MLMQLATPHTLRQQTSRITITKKIRLQTLTLLPLSRDSSSRKRISGVSRNFIRFPSSLLTYLAFDFNPASAISFPLSSPKTDTYTLTTYYHGQKNMNYSVTFKKKIGRAHV